MADIDFLLENIDEVNIAEKIDENTLDHIAATIVKGVETDESSRHDWMRDYDKWQELAAQVTERKSWPWDGAANVKYPLLNIASIQFHARAYPEIVTEQPVKAQPVGHDPEGERQGSAHRIAQHLSYQLLYENDSWQEEMDRLLIALPIAGTMFRKVYFSPTENKIKSEVVNPRNLVVNYYAKSLETAPRITHIQQFHWNEIVENINGGIFRDCEIGKPRRDDGSSRTPDKIQGRRQPTTEYQDEVPHTVYECHTWWDLDEDGYNEPYIVTVEKDSRKVLRIVARYTEDLMDFNDDGSLYRIKPFNHFQNYVFIPDPNSEIYGLGFGHLLGPLNEAVNTIINQLIDAGTLSNMQSGFISKGVRVKGGHTKFRPGEWKITHTSGEDLQKGIYPLPVREPSQVLFSLLGTLIESGQQLSSVTDIMVGESPGQNQPAHTTMSVMEQGQKVFTGIFKRIYRSLTREFQKMYYINSHQIEAAESYEIAVGGDINAYRRDYFTDHIMVYPSANPENVTDAQRMAKAETLWPLVQAGLINPQEFARRYVEAQGHENIEALLETPEPQPDPETELKAQEMEHKQNYDWAKLQIEALSVQAQAQRNEAAAIQALAQAGSMEVDNDLKREKQMLETIRTREDIISKRVDKLLEMGDRQQEREMQQPEGAQPQPRPEEAEAGMVGGPRPQPEPQGGQR